MHFSHSFRGGHTHHLLLLIGHVIRAKSKIVRRLRCQQYAVIAVVVLFSSANARFMCWSGFALVWWWWCLFVFRICCTYEFSRCDMECAAPQPRVFFFATLLKPNETYFPHNVVLYRWVKQISQKRNLSLITYLKKFFFNESSWEIHDYTQTDILATSFFLSYGKNSRYSFR